MKTLEKKWDEKLKSHKGIHSSLNMQFDQLSQEEFYWQLFQLIRKSDLSYEEEDFPFMDRTVNEYLGKCNAYLEYRTAVEAANDPADVFGQYLDYDYCFKSCCDRFGASLNPIMSHEESLYLQLTGLTHFLNNRTEIRKMGLLKKDIDAHQNTLRWNEYKKVQTPKKFIRLCKLFQLFKKADIVTYEMIDKEIAYTKERELFEDLDDLEMIKRFEIAYDDDKRGFVSTALQYKTTLYSPKNNGSREKTLFETSRLLTIMEDFPIFFKRKSDENNPEYHMTLEELYVEMFEGLTLDDMKKDIKRLKQSGIVFN